VEVRKEPASECAEAEVHALKLGSLNSALLQEPLEDIGQECPCPPDTSDDERHGIMPIPVSKRAGREDTAKPLHNT